jgi:hypothetical protein
MPDALREWCRLTGSHDSIQEQKNQDYETPLERVGRSPRWLEIYGENQDTWECGVLREHCDLPDPPVHLAAGGISLVIDWKFPPESLVEGRFVEVSKTLTGFVFDMALRQAVIRNDRSPFMRPEVGMTGRDSPGASAVTPRPAARAASAGSAGRVPGRCAACGRPTGSTKTRA